MKRKSNELKHFGTAGPRNPNLYLYHPIKGVLSGFNKSTYFNVETFQRAFFEYLWNAAAPVAASHLVGFLTDKFSGKYTATNLRKKLLDTRATLNKKLLSHHFKLQIDLVGDYYSLSHVVGNIDATGFSSLKKYKPPVKTPNKTPNKD